MVYYATTADVFAIEVERRVSVLKSGKSLLKITLKTRFSTRTSPGSLFELSICKKVFEFIYNMSFILTYFSMVVKPLL